MSLQEASVAKYLGTLDEMLELVPHVPMILVVFAAVVGVSKKPPTPEERSSGRKLEVYL